eukprot:83447_1
MKLVLMGATSHLGRWICRCASMLGWRVTAFSKQKRVASDEEWSNLIQWRTYKTPLDIKPYLGNCDGVIQTFEDDWSQATSRFSTILPFLSMRLHNNCRENTDEFIQNAEQMEKLCQLCGVRHFMLVEDHSRFQAQSSADAIIGQKLNGQMITTLIKPAYLYSLDRPFSLLFAIPLRMLAGDYFLSYLWRRRVPLPSELSARWVGPNMPPLQAKELARVITTLIHNSNDPDMYRIMEPHHVHTYVESQASKRVVKVSHFHDGRHVLTPLKLRRLEKPPERRVERHVSRDS